MRVAEKLDWKGLKDGFILSIITYERTINTL
jgi:hypothetical protein